MRDFVKMVSSNPARVHHQLQEQFPEENFEAMRRPYLEAEAVNINNATYKPVAEPAWDRHKAQLGPKHARFEKLTRWGQRSNVVQQAVVWAVVAIGAVTLAGPVILTHLPH